MKHFFLLFAYFFSTSALLKINNGDKVCVGELKYVVAIYTKPHFLCTGGILDEYHILSSAHCFVEEKTNEFYEGKTIVAANTIDVMAKVDPRRIVRQVDRIYIPSYYVINNFYGDGDIAVLKLKEPLDLSQTDKLQALLLPEDSWCLDEIYRGKEGVIAGFGAVMQNCKLYHSGKLAKLKVKVLSDEECEKRSGVRSQRNLCTELNYDDEQIRGTCQGDSGGPLVINGDEVIGVLRYADKDGNDNNRASVYTKVSSYLEFIYDAMAGDGADMRIRYHES